MKRHLIITFLITILAFGCSKQALLKPGGDTLTIGTFNVAWLGDGINDRNDRTEADYKQIADVIKDCGADIIGLQEIESYQAVGRVLKYLPDYSCFVGSGGRQQNVAVLFHKDVEVESVGEYAPVAIVAGRNRPGYVVQAKKGNFDFLLMVVHFKSTSHYDNTKEKQEESRDVRELQAEIVSHWADSLLSNGSEKDIFIVGDFNDTPMRKKNTTLSALMDNPNLRFLTKDLKSCRYKSMYGIDHIVASLTACNRLIRDSERMYDQYSALPDVEAKKVSDHCPVLAGFETKSPDND